MILLLGNETVICAECRHHGQEAQEASMSGLCLPAPNASSGTIASGDVTALNAYSLDQQLSRTWWHKEDDTFEHLSMQDKPPNTGAAQSVLRFMSCNSAMPLHCSTIGQRVAV